MQKIFLFLLVSWQAYYLVDALPRLIMAMPDITGAVFTGMGISLTTAAKVILALILDNLSSVDIFVSMGGTGTFSAGIGTGIIMVTSVGEAATEGIGGNRHRISY
ncbi:MAG: hypothetical protein DYH15_03490 [Nitrosomonas sp. PRO4]|nr:hypothetical protein [Nitrosomonas sp. PRO4]